MGAWFKEAKKLKGEGRKTESKIIRKTQKNISRRVAKNAEKVLTRSTGLTGSSSAFPEEKQKGPMREKRADGFLLYSDYCLPRGVILRFLLHWGLLLSAFFSLLSAPCSTLCAVEFPAPRTQFPAPSLPSSLPEGRRASLLAFNLNLLPLPC